MAFADPAAQAGPSDETHDEATGETESVANTNAKADPSKASKRREVLEAQLPPDSTTYAVPIGIGNDVTIHGKLPMSEKEWNQFQAVLAAMKPALVVEPEAVPVQGAMPIETDSRWESAAGGAGNCCMAHLTCLERA